MKVITALTLATALLFAATHADAKGHKRRHHGKRHHAAAKKEAAKPAAEPKK